MAALQFRRRRTRRLWALGGTTATLAMAVLFLLVASASGTLNGSTFNTGNGSLTDLNIHDWNPAGSPAGNVGPVEPITCPGTNCGLDLVNNSSDNSLGQGSKEDDTTVSVVSGQIPPQKDDLSRFYVNKEHRNIANCGGTGINSCDYLYLAWERSNLLGSAHMDFELNQANPGINSSSSGATAINRTANDILIDFDFGGSGQPVLSAHRWITSGPASNCEANNAVPCWDKGVNLTASGFAEGSVNGAPVTDFNPPGAPRTLSGDTKSTGGSNPKITISSTFGEAGINLTGANIFPQGTCEHFGAAWLKSRSSGESFTSELKDFIAPIPVNISNCGQVIIKKRTEPRGVNQSFSFTSTLAGSDITCTQSSAASFSLNDSGNTNSDSAANTQDCTNVPAGSYTVTEGADPSGFAFKDPGGLTCTASTGSSGSQDGTTKKKANITLAAGGLVTCVYVNVQQLGAIKFTKTSSKPAGTALSGAHFRICTNDGPYDANNPCTPAKTGSDDLVTESDGTVCVGDLGFGDYYVSEKAAPAGYDIDDASVTKVNVGANAKCSDAVFGGTAKTYTDTPLTDILAKAKSQATGGTKSSVTCVDSNDADVGNSPEPDSGFDDPAQVTANGLKPGTYTCTIVIDP
jgi:hypothetical protein